MYLHDPVTSFFILFCVFVCIRKRGRLQIFGDFVIQPIRLVDYFVKLFLVFILLLLKMDI